MGLFSKKIGPVFLKETSDVQEFIDKLQELQKRAGSGAAKKIESQIKIARYGKQGEDNIAFELKNSGMDMYILHDIYLQSGENAAQIDYLVITRKHIYVIECKNLIGNIEIDSTGAFIRSYEREGKRVKEGIYSPITQNERHLQILKEIRRESKSNFFTKMLFDKSFEESYQSIVVLANPKTYLNARYAQKQIKEKVIRADQLIAYIRHKDALDQGYEWNDAIMLELAQFYLDRDKRGQSDYLAKYEEMIKELNTEKILAKEEQPDKPAREAVQEAVKNEKEDAQEKEEKIRRLKEFRLQQSRKEKIRAYYIFNDAQMNDLLEKNPRNKVELLNISGFGSVKVEKYGGEILKILCDDNNGR